VMVFIPSKEQLRHFKVAFDMFDTDKDGLLGPDDIVLMMATFGRSYSKEEVKEYIEDLAVNVEGDEFLDFAEFIVWLMKLGEYVEESVNEIQEADDAATDAQLRKGSLTRKKLKARAKMRARRHQRQQLELRLNAALAGEDKTVFDRFDVDGKGFVSFEDLCREVAKSGEPWDITLLDEMMSSAVLPGEPRRVTFQQWQWLMHQRICWDEPEMYDCQYEKLQQQERMKRAELEKEKRMAARNQKWREGYQKRSCVMS